MPCTGVNMNMIAGFKLDFPLTLECDDSFNLSFRLVHGDTLEINKGLYYLSGDNGSGKTSFVNMLALIAGRIGRMPKKGNGKISFKGTVYSDERFSHINAAEIREKYFCIFPQKAFFLPISTRDNYLILDGNDRDLAKKFSSEEYPDLLSGGQQQKILMDIVLNDNKPIWFLDEPLSNMDKENRDYFWQKIKSALKAKVETVFFIDHWIEAEIKEDKSFQYVNTVKSSGYRVNSRPWIEDNCGEIEIFRCENPDRFVGKQLKNNEPSSVSH